jgi:hypothetical protein
MPANARDRARTLELIIRAATAEERLLARRLQGVADAQRKTRANIASEISREHFGHPPRPLGQADGSSDR